MTVTGPGSVSKRPSVWCAPECHIQMLASLYCIVLDQIKIFKPLLIWKGIKDLVTTIAHAIINWLIGLIFKRKPAYLRWFNINTDLSTQCQPVRQSEPPLQRASSINTSESLNLKWFHIETFRLYRSSHWFNLFHEKKIS